ncbi:MAG TPA: holo-ACP synthase [Fimbriimonas sp.]|nr:holo-ACP synthase [Fimbriimonas sp.]
MIVGVGVDLVEIARIERAMKRTGFAERILTPMEREFCVKTHQVAGRWAAKEAVQKAVGLPLTWQDVEILPDEIGVPRATIRSANFDPGRLKIHVSISHERNHAIATAILERIVFQAPAP